MKNHTLGKVPLFLAVFLLFLAGANIYAQQPAAAQEPLKFALVIGNGAYADLGRLANPVNDAHDVASVLQDLGFTVDKVLDGSLNQMVNAVMQMKRRLSASPDAYGFFFYAGHGVQSNGENFLIPADAMIPSENFLRNRSVSVQEILDELNDAGNYLNVVVLDACRDNPFSWSRSGSRGLTVVGRQPADSIIVYATGAGQRASDGAGRNGLFTSQLLNNLKDHSLEITEVFRRTGAEVSSVSGRQQVPAIYNQFFGTAYLGIRPSVPEPIAELPQAEVATTETVVMETAAAEIIAKEPSQPTVIQTRPINPVNPARPVVPPKEKTPLEPEAFRLNTVGASVGTSFSAPWFIGTVQGTIAPWRNSFFDLGMDMGLGSGNADIGYYSFCPFVHYAFFTPITNRSGWYIGAGAGLAITRYAFPEGDISENLFAFDTVIGFIIGNHFTISYTLRTDFGSASNKIAVGYAYRF